MNSGCWRSVDAGNPEFFVEYLDRAAAGLREARQEAIRALDVAPGSAVLDVGCGVGEFLIELATSVPVNRAVGIDASETLLAVARDRATAASAKVEFRVGDVERLDLPDGAFERVNCSRVLLHLERPEAAVAEMARVLAPGGRIVIWEPDLDALMIDSDSRAVATAVRDALEAGLRNPDIGRRLRRLVLDADLVPVEVQGRAVPLPNLQYALDQFHLFEHLDTAVAAGVVGAEDARRWREWIEAADASGRFLVALVGFRVIAARTR